MRLLFVFLLAFTAVHGDDEGCDSEKSIDFFMTPARDWGEVSNNFIEPPQGGYGDDDYLRRLPDKLSPDSILCRRAFSSCNYVLLKGKLSDRIYDEGNLVAIPVPKEMAPHELCNTKLYYRKHNLYFIDLVYFYMDREGQYWLFLNNYSVVYYLKNNTYIPLETTKAAKVVLSCYPPPDSVINVKNSQSSLLPQGKGVVKTGAGRVNFLFFKRGYATDSLKSPVNLLPGSMVTAPPCTLKPIEKAIFIDASVKGMDVVINNTRYGKTPINVLLTGGKNHDLRVSGPGVRTIQNSLFVDENLDSIFIETWPIGYAKLSAHQKNAEIRCDRCDGPVKPKGTYELKPGRYTFHASATSYKPADEKVDIQENVTTEIVFDLEKSAIFKWRLFLTWSFLPGFRRMRDDGFISWGTLILLGQISSLSCLTWFEYQAFDYDRKSKNTIVSGLALDYYNKARVSWDRANIWLGVSGAVLSANIIDCYFYAKRRTKEIRDDDEE